LPSGKNFPKKPTKLNDFFQFFILQMLMFSCFLKNLLPKKSLYAFIFLQFQQVGMKWTRYSNSLSLYNQLPWKEQRGSKYFNSFSIFFHLINDLLTPSICRHGWQPYSQFQSSKDSLLYQHLKKSSKFHMC
jgi:hypothetical protein